MMATSTAAASVTVRPEQSVDHESSPRRFEKVNYSMTNEQRRQLCLYAEENPKANQRQLIEWFKGQFNVAPSQAAISRCLKRKSYILESREADPNLKRLKKVTYPLMEDALYKWYTEYKGLLTIDGNVLKQKGIYYLKVCTFLNIIYLGVKIADLDTCG
ncbi:hypothetical protein V1511DRAFT_394777 [Dipodascopsis uninucleata]